jgi:hypothetical protein
MSGKNKAVGLLTILVLLGGLSSCGGNNNTASSTTDDPKTRWLNGEPCSPPCWENIQPDSTPSQAIDLLKQSPIIDPSSVYLDERKDEGIGVITWVFASDSTTWSGRLAYPLTKSNISGISLTVPDLCLKEIIEAYGEPDYLHLIAYQVADVVNLIWQSYSFVYEKKLDSPTEDISDNVCGGTIIQFPVSTALEAIPSPYFMGASEEYFVPWTGYGAYGK